MLNLRFGFVSGKSIILSCILIFLLVNLSCVFASDNQTEIIEGNIVNSDNFNQYFDNENCLKDDFANSTLTFEGNFTEKGIITIKSSNVELTGRNSSFINTVLCIENDNVTISDIDFKLNKSFELNGNSCIFIKNDNTSISNVKISCNFQEDETGIGIYSCNENRYLKIVNSEISFIGRVYHDGFNYAILINNIENVIMSNNKINCFLPLRGLARDYETYGNIGVVADAAIAMDSISALVFENNIINVSINNRLETYASLDACFFYNCGDVLIRNNTLFENDYFTQKGEDNSLYGFYIQQTQNMIFYQNNIHVKTTGGSENTGVAYPIQIKGPTGNVKIAFNNISAYSNGAACGIFSKVSEDSQIEIISNKITTNIMAKTKASSIACASTAL